MRLHGYHQMLANYFIFVGRIIQPNVCYLEARGKQDVEVGCGGFFICGKIFTCTNSVEKNEFVRAFDKAVFIINAKDSTASRERPLPFYHRYSRHLRQDGWILFAAPGPGQFNVIGDDLDVIRIWGDRKQH